MCAASQQRKAETMFAAVSQRLADDLSRLAAGRLAHERARHIAYTHALASAQAAALGPEYAAAHAADNSGGGALKRALGLMDTLHEALARCADRIPARDIALPDGPQVRHTASRGGGKGEAGKETRRKGNA